MIQFDTEKVRSARIAHRTNGVSLASDAFRRSIVEGILSATTKQCSRWCMRYRVMGAPYPGPFTFYRHPWTKAMLDDDHEEIVGKKAAQMGYTDSWAMNRSFFTLDQLKRDVLYVLPAKTPDATDFTASRFDPALEMSPYLGNLFTNVNNIGHKRAGANSLYIRGSRSRNALKSLPAGLIVLDEMDEFDDDAVPLVRERSSGQAAKQLLMLSTPSMPDTGIALQYKRSSAARFTFRCPSCNRHTVLDFPDCLVVTADDELDPAVQNSHLVCKECRAVLPNETKPLWLAGGEWVHAYPDRAVRGYHISQLYSCAHGSNPVEIARSFLRAQKSEVDLLEFYNSKLGMEHVIAGRQITDEHIAAVTRTYKSNAPELLRGFITIGIDVGTFCHYVVIHWQFRDVQGSTDVNEEAIGHVIAADTFASFVEADAILYTYKPQMVVIDAQPETREAMALAARFPGNVKLCHYGNNLRSRDIVDFGDRVTVDRTSWLDMTLGRFIGGSISLPADMTTEYRDHIKSFVRRIEKHKISGEYLAKYRNTGPDHFGHAQNYAEIALRCAIDVGRHGDIGS